jgi:hypothetical protein
MDFSVDQIKTELSTLAVNLLDALESGDPTKILVAQQAFSGTIATLWKATEEIDIDPKLKAVSRLVVGWAINELPQQIQNPANNPEIKRQLKLFQRSLIMLK